MESLNRPMHNAIQERICRTWRPAFGIIAWHSIGRWDTGPNKQHDTIIDSLSLYQQSRNTIRGTTPGLIDPILGEIGGRIPLPVMKLGTSLSRVEAIRLRKAQKQAGEQAFSDALTETPSTGTKDNNTTQGVSIGFKRSADEVGLSSKDGQNLFPLPSGLNPEFPTTHSFSLTRPSVDYLTGGNTSHTAQARAYPIASLANLNGSSDEYISRVAVNESKIRRQQENWTPRSEEDPPTVPSRGRKRGGRRLRAPRVSESVTAQPDQMVNAQSWLPPLRRGSDAMPSSLSLWPQFVIGQSQMKDFSPTPIVPVAPMPNSLFAGDREPRQEFRSTAPAHSLRNSATDSLIDPRLLRQDELVSQDRWTVKPAVNYNLPAE